MLNQHNNDGGGQMGGHGGHGGVGDLGHAHGLKAARHGAQDGKLGFRAPVAVHEPGHKGVEQDDKDGAQGVEKEEGALTGGEAFAQSVAREANSIEQEEGGETHGSIEIGSAEMLEGMTGQPNTMTLAVRIDYKERGRKEKNGHDDQIGGVASAEASDAHHGRHLAGGNVDGRSRHEGGDGDGGNEFNDETQSQDA